MFSFKNYLLFLREEKKELEDLYQLLINKQFLKMMLKGMWGISKI